MATSFLFMSISFFDAVFSTNKIQRFLSILFDLNSSLGRTLWSYYTGNLCTVKNKG